MSMGYDIDDPRHEATQEALRLELYGKPGSPVVTRPYGPIPNGAPDQRNRFFS